MSTPTLLREAIFDALRSKKSGRTLSNLADVVGKRYPSARRADIEALIYALEMRGEIQDFGQKRPTYRLP